FAEYAFGDSAEEALMATRLLFRPKLVTVLLLAGQAAHAQMTDQTQTPNLEGAGIVKSLDQAIGAGVGDALTPNSSTYIILRDPARAIRRGRQLFQRKFTLT